ncbi:MAG: 2-dehydro-3-deoxy-6-phosphogalactonate aldolase, partial [Methylobacteriaceae bacterium]|nr:2-dehydro-3-deoxy-6-phosphogalactonate aldolase [Methylobacteriaceae bacterium]
MSWTAAAGDLPLVAILRGVKPDEVVGIGAALVEAGFRLIEVPLNSPAPFDSIARLQARFGGQATIGAGTVTTGDEVAALVATGAKLCVSPHF